MRNRNGVSDDSDLKTVAKRVVFAILIAERLKSKVKYPKSYFCLNKVSFISFRMKHGDNCIVYIERTQKTFA